MPHRYEQDSHKIDMSGRLQVTIGNADSDEIEQNREYFDNINKSIENAMKENSVVVNDYVKDLLIKQEDETLVNSPDFIKNNKKRGIKYIKILIILTTFIATLVFICRPIDKSNNVLKFITYLAGIIYGLLPFFLIIAICIIITPKAINSKKFNRAVLFLGQTIFCTIGIILSFSNTSSSFHFVTDLYAKEPYFEIYSSVNGSYDLITPNDNEETNTSMQENTVLQLNYTDDFINNIAGIYDSIEYENLYGLAHQNENIIAKDMVSGEEYTVKKLFNQSLLVPYKDGEKNVIFYGQYNENNNWDGNCVFNIYEYDEDIKENILSGILEAVYQDGNLISYKKIEKSITGQGANVWSLSNRKTENEYTTGETWNYFWKTDYLPPFQLDKAEAKDIIYFNDFESKLKSSVSLEGYYFGNTSNGYYNDNTGSAYLVKYAEDGTIRTFYSGCFLNGFPDDQTGNAWQIVFDSSNSINRYFYYEGIFKNGKRKGRITSDNYITQETIDELLENRVINCPLNWYGTDNLS